MDRKKIKIIYNINTISQYINQDIVTKIFNHKKIKLFFESLFWFIEIIKIMRWAKFPGKKLYDTENVGFGKEKSKIDSLNLWLNEHQNKKYRNIVQNNQYDIELNNNSRILDLGSGPFPSLSFLKNTTVVYLDPLFKKYKKIGYPLILWSELFNHDLIEGESERIPLKDHIFDLVLSINSLDHVDDLFKSIEEIKRILKINGTFLAQFTIHKPTFTEPQAIALDKLEDFLKIFEEWKIFDLGPGPRVFEHQFVVVCRK